MVLLDTCVVIFDALTPDQVSVRARPVLEEADRASVLACSDISLWEIAVLSTELPSVRQLDPADRIIAATAVVHGATLLTSDAGLRNAQEVRTVW